MTRVRIRVYVLETDGGVYNSCSHIPLGGRFEFGLVPRSIGREGKSGSGKGSVGVWGSWLTAPQDEPWVWTIERRKSGSCIYTQETKSVRMLGTLCCPRAVRFV